MNKKVVIGVVIVAVLLIGYFIISNTGVDDSNGVSQGDYNIEINNFAFSQDNLNIKVGETIVWTNKDSAKHTVTSDTGSELDSEVLSKGQSYSHTFNVAGEFDYHCNLHSYMKGKIIVE